MNKRRGAKNRGQDGQPFYRSQVHIFQLSELGRMVGVKSVTSLHQSRKIQDKLDMREAAIIEDLRELELFIEAHMKDDQRYTMGEMNVIPNFEDMADDDFPDEDLNFPGHSKEEIVIDEVESIDSSSDDGYQYRYANDDVEEYPYEDGDRFLDENDDVGDYQWDGVNYGYDDLKFDKIIQYRDANDGDEGSQHAYVHQHPVANNNDNEDIKFDVITAERKGEISEEVYDEQLQTWATSYDSTPYVTLADQLANDWTESMQGKIVMKSEDDLSKQDENKMNDESPDLFNELVDLHISDKHPFSRILFNLRRHIEKQPIFKAILASDINAFFQEVVNSKYVENTKCEICFCSQNIPKEYRGSRKDLLHIAAAVSTVKFVKTMVDPELCSQAIRECGRDKPNIESIEEHYKQTVKDWLAERSLKYCTMSPVCVAAEFNRVDMVSMLLSYSVEQPKQKKEYPLLDTLVYNRSLNKIDPPDFIERLVDNASDRHLDHAIRTAIEVGDYEGMLKEIDKYASVRIEKIGELREEEADVRSKKSFIPGMFTSDMKLRHTPERNSVESLESPTYAQILAENELTEQFEMMQVSEKTEKNAFGWTSLVALLNFPDGFVERQLPFFRSVKREDLFLFISQVIIKNRLNLLTTALEMVFLNPNNFEKIETDIYETYGLPEFIALPMETALSRTGDMRIVEHIAGFYMKQDNFTKLIIREDALRCIRSIQDKASQVSDHIRLAVIMMMRKFVDMTTYEFRETLRMYPQQSIDDPVEAYVMQHFVQWAYLQDKMPLFITWKDAFEQAGLAVGKWSTVETVLPIIILEKTRKNIQIPKSISVNSERAGQKKREKLANEEAKLFETLDETSAAHWRIYELSNFGY